MKSLLATASLVAALAVPASAETWYVDPTHTDVVAAWNHAGFSMQTLKFHEVEGSLEFVPGEVEAAQANFSILVDSVDTGLEILDTELKGEAFFNSAEYPTISFVSTSVEQTGEMTVTATGNLTMLGVTNPVSFEILVHNLGEHPLGQFFEYNQGEWLGMTATTSINRSEWGLGHLIPVGSDQIDITINVELKAGGFAG